MKSTSKSPSLQQTKNNPIDKVTANSITNAIDNAIDNVSAIDKTKRDTLKKIGVAAGVATGATTTGSTIASAAVFSDDTTQSVLASVDSAAPQLTINLQMNRDDLDDWVLIENMTEEPLLVRSFEPRYITYNNTVLDLQALLTRQQKGKQQLEIWPNYTWTHSVRGATRATHPLRPSGSVTHTARMNGDCRSTQINASVSADGRVRLLPG